MDAKARKSLRRERQKERARARQDKPRRAYLYASVFTVNLLMVAEGNVLTWAAPVIEILRSNSSDNPFGHPITLKQCRWIEALASLGAALGPYLYPLGTPWIGRRWMFLAIAIQLLICRLVLTFSRKIVYYYVARVFSGCAVGMLLAVTPTYISEISENVNRGLLGSTMSIFEIFGCIVSYPMGLYMPLMYFNFACCSVPLLFIILFLPFVIETPQWLILHGNAEKAKRNLMKLRSRRASKRVHFEFNEMTTLLAEKKHGNLMDVFRFRDHTIALIISVAMISFQQLSGITPIFVNINVIFAFKGMSSDSNAAYVILTGLAGFIGTFATPLLVERKGRKALILTSSIAMCVAQAILGVYFHIPHVYKWVPLACLIVFVVGYVLGSGVLAFTVMAELSSSDVSSVIAACQISTLSVIGFILTISFAQTVEAIGMYGVFYMYGTCNFFAAVFTYFCLPETKGMSPGQIKSMLKRHSFSASN